MRTATSPRPIRLPTGTDYYHNDTASDTVIGGLLGAATGAIAGGHKHAGAGALIGAGVGAVTGNFVGQSKDRPDERKAAAGAATAANLNQQAAAMAVTNADLVGMTRAGVSDDLIVSTMRSRGTQLDLSPPSLIALKQNGVSDRVVLAAQDMNRGSYYAPPGGVAVVPPPPTTVIVAPRPYYGYYHPYPYYHGGIYYRVR